MSATKNNAVRCDWCGKLSSNQLGEYTKPDGRSAGYINSPEWERNEDGSYKEDGGWADICEECEANRCPGCGSDQVVSSIPAFPGPTAWGARCEACGHEWSMPDMIHQDDDGPDDTDKFGY